MINIENFDGNMANIRASSLQPIKEKPSHNNVLPPPENSVTDSVNLETGRNTDHEDRKGPPKPAPLKYVTVKKKPDKGVKLKFAKMRQPGDIQGRAGGRNR